LAATAEMFIVGGRTNYFRSIKIEIET